MAYNSSAITTFLDGSTPATGTVVLGSLFEAEFDQLYGNWQHFFGVAGTTLTVDNVTEKTTDNGILIESVQHKDNYIWTTGATDLIFGTNSTDYLHITSAGLLYSETGKLAVGTTSVKGTNGVVHIANGTNADTNWLGNAPLIIENDDDAYVNIRTPNNKIGGIAFSDPDATSTATITYDHNDNSMDFRVNAISNVLFLDNTGFIGINENNPDVRLTISDAAIAMLKLKRTDAGHAAMYMEVNSTARGTLAWDNTNSILKLNCSGNITGDAHFGIDINGLIGMGTSSPSSYNSNTNNLVIREDGNVGITLSAGATGNSYIAFNDGEDTTLEGLIGYNQSTEVMSFRTNSIDNQLVIGATGYIKSNAGRWPTGHIGGNAVTENSIFDSLSSYIPNTSDEILLTGSIGNTGSTQIWFLTYASRYNSTTIVFHGMSYIVGTGWSGNSTVNIVDGSSDTWDIDIGF